MQTLAPVSRQEKIPKALQRADFNLERARRIVQSFGEGAKSPALETLRNLCTSAYFLLMQASTAGVKPGDSDLKEVNDVCSECLELARTSRDLIQAEIETTMAS